MVQMMEIPGLGAASLPAFLQQAQSSMQAPGGSGSATAEETANQDDANDAPETRLVIPRRQGERFNATHTLALKIAEMAKYHEAVFEMVTPQLRHMYENCVLMVGNKSGKVAASKAAVATSKTQLPVMPASIRRNASDDINQANRKRSVSPKAACGKDGGAKKSG